MIMTAKVTDNDSIAVGELYENGVFVMQYEVFKNQVDTEQKVLAWVYSLCLKQGVDQWLLKAFIDCCTTLHPSLDIESKD